MNKKLSILSHYIRAKRAMRLSKEALVKRQERQKEWMYRFASAHSPFYRERAGELINKKIMMENFSTFNTANISKERAFDLALSAERSRSFDQLLNGITVGLSSGTSGNRGLFLASEKERMMWCGNILAKALPHPPWKRQKIALFLRANSPLYQTINSKTLQFAYFDLLEDPERLIDRVRAFDPDTLVAPPSMLNLLVGSCRPSRVISIAETLLRTDKVYLEAAFSQPIHQIYQATEGFLGFTCSHGTLHLNEDLLIVEKEWIDGLRFSPIITDLYRTTQPIIRYQLDDILVAKSEGCPCGCPYQALEQIEGRCDDLLTAQTIDGELKPLFPDFVARRIIAASEWIQEYEIVQTDPLEWRIFVAPEFKESVAKQLKELFIEINCQLPNLIFLSAPFPREKGAKVRRIRREHASL